MMKAILLILLGLIGGFGIGVATVLSLPGLPGFIVGPGWAVITSPSTDVGEPTGEIKKMKTDAVIALARVAVLKSLNDPYSAKFEGLSFQESSAGSIVCGMINAKNRFGAYVGAVPFYYSQVGDLAVLATGDKGYDGTAERRFISDQCSSNTTVPKSSRLKAQ